MAATEAAAAAAAAVDPSRLQLGVDIPIALRRYTVTHGPLGRTLDLMLVVPDIDAGSRHSLPPNLPRGGAPASAATAATAAAACSPPLGPVHCCTADCTAAVMEMYIAADMPDRDPYWCEPWPSAVAMSAELLQRPQLVAGKRVCELGCGLGLAGLAAAMAGARACACV